MDITNWLKRGPSLKRPRTEGLPDPRECTTEQSAQEYQAANDQVDQLTSQPKPKKRRGEYQRLDDCERLKIAKSVIAIGASKTGRKYGISESTVRSIKTRYLQMKRRTGGDELKSLPHLTRGPGCKLGDLDNKVQLCIKAARENGAAVNARVVMAAADGIVKKFARHQLAANGGHITITKTWARSVLRRMGFTQRKGTKGVKHLPKDFATIKENWLAKVTKFREQDRIPAEMVINWDQTGCNLVPGGNWTMEKKGKAQVPIHGMEDKRQITILLSVTMAGTMLPPQLLYSGKTPKCLPSTPFPEDWDVFYSENHWSNETTMLRFLDLIIIPYVNKQRETRCTPDQAALDLFDVYAAHRTDKVIKKLVDNNIRYCMVPAACTDKLQPLDLAVNKEYKHALKTRYDQWYTDQVASQITDIKDEDDIGTVKVDTRMSVIKPIHARWLTEVHSETSKKKAHILDGFVKAGLLRQGQD